MRRWMFVVLALGCFWLPARSMAADQPEEQPFKVLSAGKVRGQMPAGLAEARDKRALARIWSTMGLGGTVPKVDFKHRMVIAWVGGGNACDKYVLTHVRESATDVVLEIEHQRPPPGHMCIMIFTPSQFVAAIPPTRKPINFTVSDGSAQSEVR